MSTISTPNGFGILAIAHPTAANSASAPTSHETHDPIVQPPTEADHIHRDLPENKTTESIVRALVERDHGPDVADQVAAALSGMGLHVVNDGVRHAVELDAFGKPTGLQVAVPDAMPDKIPY